MARSLEGSLASVPGLAGFLGAQQFDQNQQLGQLQQVGALQGILAKVREQQQQEAFRGALSGLGPNASTEQLAGVAAQFGGPKEILAHADTRARIDSTKQTALMNLQQKINTEARHAYEFAQTLPLKERTVAAQEIRNRSQAAWQAGSLAIQKGNLDYNVGGDTSGIGDVISQLRLASQGGGAPASTAAAPAQLAPPAPIGGVGSFNLGGRTGALSAEPSDAEAIAMWKGSGALGRPQAGPAPTSLAALVAPAVAAPGEAGAPPAFPSERGYIPPQAADTEMRRFGAQGAVPPSGPVAPQQASKPTVPKQLTLADAPAGLSPRDKGKWLLQQTKPSIAGNADITPETATRIAQQVLSGDTSGLAGWARNQTAKTTIENEVTRLAAEAGKSGGDVSGAKAMTAANRVALTASTKDLIAIQPFKEMLDQNAKVAIDLGRKIASDKTNSAFVNRPLMWVKNNMSDRPDIAEYLAQMHFVEVEAARVLTQPRLVGQLTDQAISDMKSVLSGNMTIASTEAVLNRIMADGNNRISTMKSAQARVLADIKGEQPRTRSSDRPAGVDTSNPLLRR